MAPVARTLRWVPFEHRTHLTHLSPTPAIYSCRPTPRHIRQHLWCSSFRRYPTSLTVRWTTIVRVCLAGGQRSAHDPVRRGYPQPSGQSSYPMALPIYTSLSPPTPTRPTAWPSAVACLPSATEPRSLAAGRSQFPRHCGNIPVRAIPIWLLLAGAHGLPEMEARLRGLLPSQMRCASRRREGWPFGGSSTPYFGRERVRRP